MDNSTMSPRKWWVAGLLSLLVNGLGQLYNGQFKKAVIFFLLPYVLLTTCIILIFKHPSLLLPSGIVIIVVSTYIISDAVVVALKTGGNYHLKKYNKVLVYIALFLVCGLVFENGYSYLIKKHVVQAYKLPAASMEPTLLVGDHILIDKYFDKAKWPHRGDIAIFEFPENPKFDYIKRVVGLPGDTIEFRDKQLYINGEPYLEDYVVHRDGNVMSDEKGPRDNFGPVEVPNDSYFTLGDNRDRSYDSRFWGFVSRDKIHGVARIIYWSWDGNNADVRWNRIGMAIR